MRTKFILNIGNYEYELKDDDLMNWDDIKCSYRRDGYGGVVRSFSSQFEFVNKAKDLLLDLYLSSRFNAHATVSVLTMNNSWEFDRKFESELDFSTISWDSCVLKINSVDSSLAAIVKANKGTKYEFEIGSDIMPDTTITFDRIPMQENVKYEFTQGTSSAESADLRVRFTRNVRPWVGNVGSEIAVNRAVYYTDDQEDNDNGFLLRAEKDIDITFDYDLEWHNHIQPGGVTMLGLRIKRNGTIISLNDTTTGDFCELSNKQILEVEGAFVNSSDLPAVSEIDVDIRNFAYAIVSGIVYIISTNGSSQFWVSTGKSFSEYFHKSKNGSLSFSMKSGDVLFMQHTLTEPSSDGYLDISFVKSLFTFSWLGIGETVTIDALSPSKVLRKLIDAMTDGKIDVMPVISGFDTRLDNTFILPAESIRALDGAKLYTSFNEFCDWMSAVFGYVYTIGDKVRLGYKFVRECGNYLDTPYSYDSGFYSKVPDTKDICYSMPLSGFFVRDPDTGIYYRRWPYSDDYNDSDGHARTDVLFRINGFNPTALCYFRQYTGTALYPVVCDYTAEDLGKDFKEIRFLHRSELFDADADVMVYNECRNLSYNVDTSAIYSTVTAGYDRKDYDSVNGRDEFNFSNTYSTGCTVSDKTLSLISKYRADSFGIEFAVQKRVKDTTDNKSDKDVFFMLCRMQSGRIVPDRTATIEGAISDKVFNGAFSPIACIRANAGLIGLQADEIALRFASSTGNTDVTIEGLPMTSDITIDTPLLTCGVLEFETYEPFCDGGINGIISVSSGSRRYKGFLKEVDIAYAKAVTTKCKIIVKEVSPC